MKRALLFVMFCFCARFSHAQILIALLFGDKLNSDKIAFGLSLSPVFSTISGMDGDYKPGLGLGLYFDLKINTNLYFHPEVNPKSAFGVSNLTPYASGYRHVDELYLDNEHAAVLRKIKAISLPLLMRYCIKGHLFVEMGPQLNVLIRPRDVFSTQMDGNKITYTAKINDQVSFMDAGFAGGLEYKIKKGKGIGIGARHYYGITDVMTKISGIQRNSAFYFRVSVPITPRPKTALPPRGQAGAEKDDPAF